MSTDVKKRRKKQPERITRSQLRERGWTEAAIRDFAGEPDEILPNPFYRSGAPMQLYDLKRIKRKERTKGFRAWQEKSKARRAAAQGVADRKREETLQKVETLEIKVVKYAGGRLLRKSIEHYNNRRRWDDESFASEDDSPEFLQRIQVNYIRHQLTNYDREIEALFKRIGKQDAITALRLRIYTQIGKVYPRLREEADRQYTERLNGRPLWW